MVRKTVVPFIVTIVLVFAGCVSTRQNLEFENTEQVKTAVRSGMEVNARGPEGVTPLMTAAKENNVQVMKLLIDYGAEVRLKDDFGKSALWYAYNNDAVNAFKLLIENNAAVDFPLTFKTASTPNRKKCLRIAEEFRLYDQIRRGRQKTDMRLFETYFAKYPRGFYKQAVIRQLKKSVDHDYRKALRKGNPIEIKAFIRKYSALGRNHYVIDARHLNIRDDFSITGKVVGAYKKGEKVFALDEKFGWIRTDKGWISKTYTKQEITEIPVIKPYLWAASRKMEVQTPRRPVPEKKPAAPNKTVASRGKKEKAEKKEDVSVSTSAKTNRTPSPEILSENVRPPEPETLKPAVSESEPVFEDPSKKVRMELDEILKDPTQEKLKGFIQKYRDESEYTEIVKDARESYMRLLLGE